MLTILVKIYIALLFAMLIKHLFTKLSPDLVLKQRFILNELLPYLHITLFIMFTFLNIIQKFYYGN